MTMLKARYAVKKLEKDKNYVVKELNISMEPAGRGSIFNILRLL